MWGRSIGAGWSSEDIGQLRQSGPDQLSMSVTELRMSFDDIIAFEA